MYPKPICRRVEICGVNTSSLKNLSTEEKDKLLQKAHDGDMSARDKLIEGNLRLVLSIVQRFANRGENLDDIFQIGCVGLIKSIDNFDTNLGVKFSTYAVPMIIGEIRRYLRDNSAIRVTRSVRDLAYRALAAKESLSHELGRDATNDEIAARLGEKAADISAALDAIVEPMSLYEPIFNDDGDSIFVMDQISDTENTDEHWLDTIALREAMKGLSLREKKIVDMRFFKGRTQTEIASEIGVSQAQVSRIEKGALDKIKKSL